MKEDIGNRVKRAALWTYTSTFFSNILQFGTGVILARILGPADFGVFIAASAFTGVLTSLIVFGLPEALVHSQKVSEKQFNAAFWTMSSIALISLVSLLLGAHWLQQFYEDDRFTEILLWLTIMFFLTPFAAVSSTKLRRNMDFKAITLVRMKGLVLGIPVSLGLAVAGFGPFSLVGGGLAISLLNIYMFWEKVRWLPKRPELKPVGTLMSYAFKSSLIRIQTSLSERVDNMLVGALVGTAPLGIYNRAYSLARMPVEKLAVNLRPVLFSGLARIRDDPVRTRQIYHKSLCALALAVIPFLALFWIIAPDFIGFFYGEAWMPAVEPLRIMSLGAAAMLLTLSFRSVSAAHNLVGKEVWVHFSGLVILILLVIIFARWGLIGVAFGVTIKEIVVFFIFQRVIARSHLGFSWRMLIRALAPAVIATFICAIPAAIVYPYLPDMPGLRLIGVSVIYFSVYLLALKAIAKMWPSHEELQSALGMVLEILFKIPGIRRFKRAV